MIVANSIPLINFASDEIAGRMIAASYRLAFTGSIGCLDEGGRMNYEE